MTQTINRLVNDLMNNNAIYNSFIENREDTLNKYGLSERERKIVLGDKPELFDELDVSNLDSSIASFACSLLCSAICSNACTNKCTYGPGTCV